MRNEGTTSDQALDATTPPASPQLPVEVVRSARRKRTISGSIVDGTARILVPAGMPPEEESRAVADMVARLARKTTAGRVDLAERARVLAARYDLPVPREIVWSSRQGKRWGSCTPAQSRIRISDRLAAMPGWVLDYVLVHELAHLEVSGHGPNFNALVDRYKLAERARGYLMAANHMGSD